MQDISHASVVDSERPAECVTISRRYGIRAGELAAAELTALYDEYHGALAAVDLAP